MTDVLEALQATLEARKSASADSSYVAGLYQQGLNKILEKLGEEATETILSAKDYDGSNGARRELVAETADLWFHSLVMLTHLDVSYDEVLDTLGNRLGTSGLEEKAARTEA